MRQLANLVLLAVLFTGGPALGDDGPAPGGPRPSPPPQVAQQVLDAVRSEDANALKALAEQENPDPWLVADLLCAQGAFDAAAAFAGAAPRTQVEKLPAYVNAQRKGGSKERRAILATMLQALGAGKAQAALDAAGRMQGEPDDVPGVRIAHGRGVLLERLNRRKECVGAYRLAAEAALALGWYERAGRSFLDAGYVALEDLDWPTAQAHFESMLDTAVRLGMPAPMAGAHRNLGTALWRQGRYRDALAHMQKALAIYEALEAPQAAAEASNVAATIGRILRESGDELSARDHHERALRAARKRKDPKSESRNLVELGLTYERLGDYPRALRLLNRALDLSSDLGLSPLVSRAVTGLGIVHQSLGNYLHALTNFEHALDLAEKAKSADGIMAAVGNLGSVYAELGEKGKALKHFERALAAAEALRDPIATAVLLGNIGSLHGERGEYEKALELHQKSFGIAESIGYEPGVGSALRSIGLAYLLSGQVEKAQEWIARHLRHAEAIGDRRGVAVAQAQLAGVHDKRGETDEALELLGRAVRTFERLRATRELVHYLADLARMRLKAGDAARALAAARRAMPHLETLLGGLGEEEASAARAAHTRLFALGTLAAGQLGEPAEALYFLESGRAGALLEALRGRGTLFWADLPEDLRRAEAAAKTAEVKARRDHARALRTRSLKQARAAAKALDQAHERSREVTGRIQREAKRQAGLFYPRAATLEEIQGWLDERTALVIYGICEGSAVALVLTKEGERFVSLGSVADLSALCDALRFDAPSLPAAEATRAVEEARRRLVAPLAPPEAIQRVLVSPVGPLSYVPFGLLFGRPTVACVPSGTTWVLLREEERTEGKGVLALGDPQYGEKADAAAVVIYRGGVALTALPGTRAEARSVGDVVMLGAEASERGLREALAKRERWRAVHLACHGLVDPERPFLSSLALTRAGDEDGFLTALEVLRMRIPADIAVLSACETAKGKIARGEGILGLTRAFMYAGAPRVICSLWKVDDAATRALMVKFYALWHPRDGSPGLGAAAALKKAQEHVRAQAKWKHPHYWAAWVLWGLDD